MSEQEHGEGFNQGGFEGGSQPSEAQPEGVVEHPVEGESEQVTTRARSRTLQFSWAQVAAIVRFCHAYAAGTPELQGALKQVLGWESDAEVEDVDLAQALYPAGGVIAAYNLFHQIAYKLETNTLGFRDGVALASEIAEMESTVVRQFVRIVNLFGGEEIRYNRRMAAAEVIGLVTDSLSAEGRRPNIKEIVEWISALFAEWPGEVG